MQPTPTLEPPAGPATGPTGWLPVWIKALTKPSQTTYVEITESPQAGIGTALLWVFLAGTVGAIISGLLTAILQAAGVSTDWMGEAIRQFAPSGTQDGGSIGVGLAFSLLCSPIAGVAGAILFAIGTAFIHWVASLLGGTGTYGRLAYALAAISVPVTLLYSVISPLSAIPLLGVCFGIVSLGATIYLLVLEITAVMAVERFGAGKALLSVFAIPLILFLCACVVIAVLAASGPAIGDIFSEINQSLLNAQ